jgi:hypothetical protein
MARDIDIVIAKVRALHPDVVVAQHKVSHPGVDDDGLWFFSVKGCAKKEIMLESSSGAAPFLVEHSEMKSTADTIWDADIEKAVAEVASYIGRLKVQTANQA